MESRYTFIVFIPVLFLQAQTVDQAKWIYPMSPAIRAPRMTVDTKAAPDLAEWGDKAKKLATDWFPHVTQLLSTKDWKAPKTLRFVFRLNQEAPAWCSGNEISISADWVRKHPDDFGMVIHEMTHAIQSYPDNKVDTGWLVEGIADYIRWWKFEPEGGPSKINFEKASYKDAYRATAYWLAWVSKKYDRRLVPSLDADLRKGDDPNPTIVKLTGKEPQALWDEFRAATEIKK